ncbi:MAG: FAD:protein FMN transferase [Gammaproteobacteria bacterium]|nr:FAD:protein FMN transferase [Gammaproteobacteria bacterium]
MKNLSAQHDLFQSGIKLNFIPGVVLLVFCLISNPVQAQWFKEQHSIMGTLIQVELWSKDTNKAKQAIDAVITEMHRIDQLMSPFKEDSEISLINREAANHPVTLSIELFHLIQQAEKISQLSKGTFDISFASIGHLYDYRKNKKPGEQTINKKLSKINYKNIILNTDTHSLYFSQPGMRIDLGGIAKGYAVDKAVEILQNLKIQTAMVSAGGDSRILGDRKGRPWMIGIRHPRAEEKSRVVLPLSSVAVSTSGDYERFFIEQGKRYHHIISPYNGKSANQSQSVTILGPEATITDALSTTVFILGHQQGLAFINRLPDYDAIIIDSQGQMHYSDGLQQPDNT